MKMRHWFLSFLVLFLFLAGCASIPQPPMSAFDTGAAKPVGDQYQSKVDNFQILLDSSYSLDEGKNFLVARDIVRRINEGIPSDLEFTGGLRSFGQKTGNPTDLLYGMTDYQKPLFHYALNSIKYVGDSTPMGAALQAAGTDLTGLKGSSALILVSDGLPTDDALTAAQQAIGPLGKDLCLYTIAVGDNAAGHEFLEKLTGTAVCGLATTAKDLESPATMASFIETVFVENKKAPAVIDSDKDGVQDKADKCPNTPAGVKVDMNGCPLDSDGDGIADYLDKCPNTPTGALVDKVGCPLDSDHDGVADYLDKCPATPKGVSIDADGCPTKLTLRINFGVNNSKVTSQYYGEIAKAAQCVRDYPGNQVYIYGHTDSSGAASYNQKLSEQRALAVKNSLIEQFNIPAEKLVSRGFGEDQPIADNTTSEGRTLNRRVEVLCGADK